MSRDKPVLRAIKLLSLVARHPTGLRVIDMAEQLDAIPRAIYRDLEILLPVPLSEKTFAPPVGFSLENYLRHSFGMFTEELVRVKVRSHKSLTRYLLDRRWHLSQKNKKLKDGSLEITFEVAGTKEIKAWIMASVRLPGSLTGVFGKRNQRGFEKSTKILRDTIKTLTILSATPSLNYSLFLEGFMARVLSLSEAKARLSELVANCEKDEEDLVITRNGRPAAVLMSADEYEGWRETREILRNRALMNEIKQGLRQLEKGQRFTFEEVFGEPLRQRKRRK